jgi:hypothetical protein
MDQAQAQVTGFDVDSLDGDIEQNTHRCSVIDDEDGNPKSGFIMVGKNSPEFQAVVNRIRIDNIKRAAKRKQQLDTSTDEGAGVVARTVAANDRATAMAVVTGWFGMLREGAEMQFDKAIVERMFNKFPQWQVKVLQDLEAESNFTKAS